MENRLADFDIALYKNKAIDRYGQSERFVGSKRSNKGSSGYHREGGRREGQELD
jgi:hypothetical protein